MVAQGQLRGESGGSSIGSALRSAASAAWDWMKGAVTDAGTFLANTAERIWNFVTGDGFNTKAEVEMIRNKSNNKIADTMQLTPGYAAVANRMGGKLTNVDGSPAVMRPDGTWSFISDRDVLEAEAEMLGLQPVVTRGGRISFLGATGFELTDDDALKMEIALAKEAIENAKIHKNQGIKNYDKKNNSTVIDGITFKFTGKGLDKLKQGQAVLWANLAKAAKEAGVTQITVGSVERSTGTHTGGYSADILSLKFAGDKGDPTVYNLNIANDKRDKFKAFENAFMKQNGSEAAWSALQMQSKGNSNQIYIPKYYQGTASGESQLANYPEILAKAVEIKRKGNDDAFQIEALLKKEFPKLDKDMYAPITGSIQHVDHGHFQITRPIYRYGT